MGGKRKQKILSFSDSDSGGIIHVANIKGGVGKSTVATNLAAALAKRGPTLLIDLDVQGSATHALGKDPSGYTDSSWDLLRKRFKPKFFLFSQKKITLKTVLRKLETLFFPQILGVGKITSISVPISNGLDLIPATSDLFKNVNFLHIYNLIYNLNICRSYYKFIIIDTPSVWNSLIRMLFIQSDLNIIPVTLNALSTRSLREYLKSVKQLANKNHKVRIRIVKNEVFGKKESKLKGKTKTMSENRQFLESLCEQVVISNNAGISLLPQSIIFNLEIPESATVRNAQDEGLSVNNYKQYSSAAKAFEELAKRVLYVLNNPIIYHRNIKPFLTFDLTAKIIKIAAVVAIIYFLGGSGDIVGYNTLRPIAPQQVSSPEKIFRYKFNNNESILRLAKYAICRFTAIVPTAADIDQYTIETIRTHNLTRLPGESIITSLFGIQKGTEISFYSPTFIHNEKSEELLPVYNYFMDMVNDKHSYITGDWCERGTGGGTPHYGIDVASALYTEIISPIDGIVVLKNSATAGKIAGVVREGMVLYFAHMAKRHFNSGDHIKAGDIIGTVGMTGRTSGPHVHVGYGLATPSPSGLSLGKNFYKLTDPKLFFYREQYIKNIR